MNNFSIIIKNESQEEKAYNLLKKGLWLDETDMHFNYEINGFQTTNKDAYESAITYLKASKIKIK